MSSKAKGPCLWCLKRVKRLKNIRCQKFSRNSVITVIPNFQFQIELGDLYIIDKRDVPTQCDICGCTDYTVDLCGEYPSVYATYDGKARLSFKVYKYNLLGFVYTKYYDEIPNFGPFLYKNVGNNNYIIMYNSFKKINLLCDKDIFSPAVYIIDDRVVVCCLTQDKKFLFINENGEIIDMEIIYSEPRECNTVLFKTPYGDVAAIFDYYNYYPQSWAFTSNARGLLTKPAIQLADD
jgi:hypothetical protein